MQNCLLLLFTVSFQLLALAQSQTTQYWGKQINDVEMYVTDFMTVELQRYIQINEPRYDLQKTDGISLIPTFSEPITSDFSHTDCVGWIPTIVYNEYITLCDSRKLRKFKLNHSSGKLTELKPQNDLPEGYICNSMYTHTPSQRMALACAEQSKSKEQLIHLIAVDLEDLSILDDKLLNPPAAMKATDNVKVKGSHSSSFLHITVYEEGADSLYFFQFYIETNGKTFKPLEKDTDGLYSKENGKLKNCDTLNFEMILALRPESEFVRAAIFSDEKRHTLYEVLIEMTDKVGFTCRWKSDVESNILATGLRSEKPYIKYIPGETMSFEDIIVATSTSLWALQMWTEDETMIDYILDLASYKLTEIADIFKLQRMIYIVAKTGADDWMIIQVKKSPTSDPIIEHYGIKFEAGLTFGVENQFDVGKSMFVFIGNKESRVVNLDCTKIAIDASNIKMPGVMVTIGVKSYDDKDYQYSTFNVSLVNRFVDSIISWELPESFSVFEGDNYLPLETMQNDLMISGGSIDILKVNIPNVNLTINQPEFIESPIDLSKADLNDFTVSEIIDLGDGYKAISNKTLTIIIIKCDIRVNVQQCSYICKFEPNDPEFKLLTGFDMERRSHLVTREFNTTSKTYGVSLYLVDLIAHMEKPAKIWLEVDSRVVDLKPIYNDPTLLLLLLGKRPNDNMNQLLFVLIPPNAEQITGMTASKSLPDDVCASSISIKHNSNFLVAYVASKCDESSNISDLFSYNIALQNDACNSTYRSKTFQVKGKITEMCGFSDSVLVLSESPFQLQLISRTAAESNSEIYRPIPLSEYHSRAPIDFVCLQSDDMAQILVEDNHGHRFVITVQGGAKRVRVTDRIYNAVKVNAAAQYLASRVRSDKSDRSTYAIDSFIIKDNISLLTPLVATIDHNAFKLRVTSSIEKSYLIGSFCLRLKDVHDKEIYLHSDLKIIKDMKHLDPQIKSDKVKFLNDTNATALIDDDLLVLGPEVAMDISPHIEGTQLIRRFNSTKVDSLILPYQFEQFVFFEDIVFGSTNRDLILIDGNTIKSKIFCKVHSLRMILDPQKKYPTFFATVERLDSSNRFSLLIFSKNESGTTRWNAAMMPLTSEQLKSFRVSTWSHYNEYILTFKHENKGIGMISVYIIKIDGNSLDYITSKLDLTFDNSILDLSIVPLHNRSAIILASEDKWNALQFFYIYETNTTATRPPTLDKIEDLNRVTTKSVGKIDKFACSRFNHKKSMMTCVMFPQNSASFPVVNISMNFHSKSRIVNAISIVNELVGIRGFKPQFSIMHQNLTLTYMRNEYTVDEPGVYQESTILLIYRHLYGKYAIKVICSKSMEDKTSNRSRYIPSTSEFPSRLVFKTSSGHEVLAFLSYEPISGSYHLETFSTNTEASLQVLSVDHLNKYLKESFLELTTVNYEKVRVPLSKLYKSTPEDEDNGGSRKLFLIWMLLIFGVLFLLTAAFLLHKSIKQYKNDQSYQRAEDGDAHIRPRDGITSSITQEDLSVGDSAFGNAGLYFKQSSPAKHRLDKHMSHQEIPDLNTFKETDVQSTKPVKRDENISEQL